MDPEPSPPRTIGERYELLEELGRGGMGVVYRAIDRSLDETVALKLLRRELAGDPEVARRFRSEIKFARRVSHPNVCRIHDYGEDKGLLYISMEFVDGENLKSVVRARGALSRDEAYDVALQVAAGLEAIHKEGVIHRDLKTTNLMRDAMGRVRIMDFGIARKLVSVPGDATRPGIALGTPDYMSPEQALAHGEVDARSDLYAFGVVLFELFTGQLPFQGDTPLATLLKHLNEPPPLDGILARRLPSALIPVLRCALAKERGGRYESAAAMGAALRDALASDDLSDMPTRAVTIPRIDSRDVAAGRLGRRRTSHRRALQAAGLLLVVSGVIASAVKQPHATSERPSPPVPTPVVKAAVASPSPHSPSARATPLAFRDVPSPSQAPSAAEPDAIEPAPEPALPIGTRLFVALQAELRSDRVRTGDAFHGSLVEPLSFEGQTVAAAGTALRGRVIAVGSFGPSPFLELGLTEIEMEGTFVPVRTGAFRLTAPAPTGGGPSVVAIVIGTIAGAGLGAVLDGQRGAATGAAAGAAAGASIGTAAGGSIFTYSDRLPFKLAERLTLPPGLVRGRSSS